MFLEFCFCLVGRHTTKDKFLYLLTGGCAQCIQGDQVALKASACCAGRIPDHRDAVRGHRCFPQVPWLIRLCKKSVSQEKNKRRSVQNQKLMKKSKWQCFFAVLCCLTKRCFPFNSVRLDEKSYPVRRQSGRHLVLLSAGKLTALLTCVVRNADGAAGLVPTESDQLYGVQCSWQQVVE